MKYKKIIPVILVAAMIFSVSLVEFIKPGAAPLKSGKEVTFFVATDIHYLAENLTDGGQAFQEFINGGDGKELGYIQEIMSAFANDIKKKKPEVLIISGDLTSNGERESHLELAERLRKIEKSGTSVYVIPGNHDILNPYARGFKDAIQYKVGSISEKDFSKIYGSYGYGEAISRDESTLSYLAAPSEDVWLLMLDTAQYESNETLGHPQLDGRVAEGTADWIKQCSDMAKSKGAQLIAVMHHNLLNHSNVVTEGFTINNSEEIIELFQECGIDFALSGHTHLQDIKSYEKEGNSLYDIVTASIAVYPQKYGILKYSQEDGIDYGTAGVDVDGWSKEASIVDNKLNNFSEHSRKLYGDRIYSRIVSRLAITDFYSSEELKLMGDTYTELYLRYYEGDGVVLTEEIRNSPGFNLWLSAGSIPQQRNVLRLAEVNGDANNKLHIPKHKNREN